MEQNEKYPAINVANVFMGFRNGKLKYPITPFRFELPNGEVHHIKEIRQTHRERVGHSVHIHFVVQTKEQRYFHIVFDTGNLQWKLIQEFDPEFLFNE